MRSVQLFVPALLSSCAEAIDALEHLPALSRWLSRARYATQPLPSFEALLCAQFGLDPHGELPFAAAALIGEGREPGDAWWMRADPVHLHAERAELVLVDPSRLRIRDDEAQALAASLDAHFAEEGLRLYAIAATRWYLRLPEPAALRTTSLTAASGRSIDPLLPRGDDALIWHRRANEAQMLLHDHPVNAERAQRGEPEINSVWFWGAGVRPACAQPRARQWWADDALPVGLARCAQASWRPCPTDAARWLRDADDAEHAVVLPHGCGASDNLSGTPARPVGPATQLQSGAAPPAVAAIEANWLAPLTDSIRSGVLVEATLLTHAGNMAHAYRLRRGDLWKFWQRTPRLPTDAPHA